MEHRVGLEEAARKLADLVREAESGGSVVLTRDGAPVARLVPVARLFPDDRSASKKGDPEAEAAFARIRERMRMGWPLGGAKFVRDDAYD